MEPNPRSSSGTKLVLDADKVAFLMDPTRRLLLSTLTEPLSAAALARRLELPRQRVNYHLRALERAGFVQLVEERKLGNCTERVMRATAPSFVITPATVGPDTAGGEFADRASSTYLMAVATRSIRELATLEAAAGHEGRRVATLTLDAEIRFASAADRSAFAAELVEAFSRLVRKYHAAQRSADRAFRLTATVHPIPPPPAPDRS